MHSFTTSGPSSTSTTRESDMPTCSQPEAAVAYLRRRENRDVFGDRRSSTGPRRRRNPSRSEQRGGVEGEASTLVLGTAADEPQQ